MLEQIYKSYRKCADEINWKQYNCNDLFREYIKHENDTLKDNFFAGIVCRYWGQAGRIYTQCNRHIPFESCYDCVIDAIKYVLDKRVWENKSSSLYNDKAGPDKAMHIALKRQKALMLSKLTAFRRLSNFNTLSIDSIHDEYKDSAEGMFFELEDSSESSVSVDYIIYEYFNDNNILNGIILDKICYNDTNKFSLNKIIKELKLLCKNDFVYFNNKYNINENDFIECLKYIKNTSNKLLGIKINSLLSTLRKEFSYD